MEPRIRGAENQRNKEAESLKFSGADGKIIK